MSLAGTSERLQVLKRIKATSSRFGTGLGRLGDVGPGMKHRQEGSRERRGYLRSLRKKMLCPSDNTPVTQDSQDSVLPEHSNSQTVKSSTRGGEPHTTEQARARGTRMVESR